MIIFIYFFKNSLKICNDYAILYKDSYTCQYAPDATILFHRVNCSAKQAAGLYCRPEPTISAGSAAQPKSR